MMAAAAPWLTGMIDPILYAGCIQGAGARIRTGTALQKAAFGSPKTQLGQGFTDVQHNRGPI
jgi:hypothetical protein